MGNKMINFTDEAIANIYSYLYWTNSASCKISHDFGGIVTGWSSPDGIRFRDGMKSVCMEPSMAPEPSNCLVYSFGINYEWSFDKDFEGYGCQIYAFDPSMDQPDFDYSNHIHFFREGIGYEDTNGSRNTWKLNTLESIYERLKPIHGNRPIDILKIDVEGAEWKVIPQLIQSGMLKHVRQLALEIHFLDKATHSIVEMETRLKILKSLETEGGMVRFANRPTIRVDGELANFHSLAAFEMSFYNSKF
jgi:Methyltransferase domain